MRGLGRQGVAAAANVAAYVLVGIPLSFSLALPAGAGVPGIWAGYIVAVTVVFFLLHALARRLDWAREADKAYARSAKHAAAEAEAAAAAAEVGAAAAALRGAGGGGGGGAAAARAVDAPEWGVSGGAA
jgi:hypothetical protein